MEGSLPLLPRLEAWRHGVEHGVLMGFTGDFMDDMVSNAV